jgi:ATP-dependent RNA helicase HelY
MEFRNQIALREQKIRSRDRKLRRVDLDREISDLRRDMKMHPCHSCPEREDHARIYEKYNRLKKETEGLKSRVQSRTNSIPRTFDKVVDVLTELDYVNNEQLTEKGRTLSRIYAETDLLLSEMIHAKMLDNLGPAELAAFVSSLVYEGRGERSRIPRIPRNIDDIYKETSQIWRRLVLIEDEYGLTTQREPNFDLAWSTYRWANGNSLQSVLRETDVLVGDFVRNMRQVIDLLNQLRDVRIDWAPRITTAIKSIDRGVVAYSTVIL